MSRSLSHRTSAGKDASSNGDSASVTPAPSSSAHEDAANTDEAAARDADSRFWYAVAGLSGATAVCLGAFGAHGLKNRVSAPRYLEIWQTAAHYHLVHAFALALAPIVVGSLRAQRRRTGLGVWASLRHNLGLGGTAAAAQRLAVRPTTKSYRNWSARCFMAGTLVFSGSLYALVLTENNKLGAITPLGGAALILGWLLLAVGL